MSNGVDAQVAGDAAQVAEASVTEEYKVWKKNAPFLYDMVLSHALEWPSLTAEWLPDKTTVAEKEYSVQRLVLGTHTSGNEANYLMLASVKMPLDATNVDGRKYDEQRGEIGGFGAVPQKVELVQRIVHDGEVNRARHMPAKPNVIATKTISGAVCVFDYTKHASEPDPTQTQAKPDVVCRGHSAEGYGLAWSPLKAGALLSGADDHLVCSWDVGSASHGARELQPLSTFRGHTGSVGDVAWHPHNDHFFGSVGDDKLLLMWDARQSASPTQRVEAHEASCNTLAFNPYCEFVLVTGADDNDVAMWDLRNLSGPVHTFVGHQDSVMRVEWAPFCERVLASAGEDRRVHVWDAARIGAEQTAEDAEDGVPELLFIHGGHTSRIADFNWNPNEAWTMASTSDDNVCQIWTVAENLYAAEEDNVAEDN